MDPQTATAAAFSALLPQYSGDVDSGFLFPCDDGTNTLTAPMPTSVCEPAEFDATFDHAVARYDSLLRRLAD